MWLPGLPAAAKSLLELIGNGPTETSVAFSVGLIALYALVAIGLARAHFNWADVAKRVS